jgi:hypothetical protein
VRGRGRQIGRTRQNVSIILHRAGRDPVAREAERLATKREHFCKVWRASGTLAAVAKALGVTVQHVRDQAAKLRARGVKLKKLSGLRDRAARELAKRERFIAVWNAASTVEEVARLLGRDAASVKVYAVRLRRLGMRVKYRRKPPPPNQRAYQPRPNGTATSLPKGPARNSPPRHRPATDIARRP